MHLYFRPATPQDLQSVKRIDELLFKDDSYPLFVLRQLLDICVELFKVAVCEEQVVGYAIAHYDADSRKAWFLSLGVLQKYRGKGIGEGLMRLLMEEVVGKGAIESYLTVHPDNSSGISIYKRLGFVVKDEEDGYYGDSSPRIIMVKTTNKA